MTTYVYIVMSLAIMLVSCQFISEGQKILNFINRISVLSNTAYIDTPYSGRMPCGLCMPVIVYTYSC